VIHLDTSFLIRAMRSGSTEDKQLRSWLREGETVRISAIVWTEFLCGPLSSEQVELARSFLDEPLAFSADHASLAADLYNASGRRRGTLADCMIAAIAIRSGARFATENRTDFSRMKAAGLVFA
jgi:predicted nucleic acid-binding protein